MTDLLNNSIASEQAENASAELRGPSRRCHAITSVRKGNKVCSTPHPRSGAKSVYEVHQSKCAKRRQGFTSMTCAAAEILGIPRRRIVRYCCQASKSLASPRFYSNYFFLLLVVETFRSHLRLELPFDLHTHTQACTHSALPCGCRVV